MYETANNDLDDTAIKLVKLYELTHPNVTLEILTLYPIYHKLQERSLIANDKLQASFQEAIKEAEGLLDAMSKNKEDVCNAHYRNEKFKKKTLGQILYNYISLTNCPGSNWEDGQISNELFLLQKEQFPDEISKELQPLIKRLKDTMEKSIELRQKCIQLEKKLQEADELYLLKEAIRQHQFSVYSKGDLLEVQQNLKERIERRSHKLDELDQLQNHLNRLEIEENPVLTKIVNLCRDVLHGEIFQKYKKIILSFFGAYPSYLPRIIDFQSKEILEKITKGYLAFAKHEDSTPHNRNFEHVTYLTDTACLWIAKDLERLGRLKAMIDDDEELHKRQKDALKNFVGQRGHEHVVHRLFLGKVSRSEAESYDQNTLNKISHSTDPADAELCEKLSKEVNDVVNEISNYIEKAEKDEAEKDEAEKKRVAEELELKSCEKLLEKAKDMLDKISKIPEGHLNNGLCLMKEDLSYLLDHTCTTDELNDLKNEINDKLKNGHQVDIYTLGTLFAEFTSLPEHKIVLEGNVIKFHIIRNTKLESIEPFADLQHLTHQKNYLMAIAYDSSFQEKEPEFDEKTYEQALKNFETNLKNFETNCGSQPNLQIDKDALLKAFKDSNTKKNTLAVPQSPKKNENSH